MAEKKPKLTPKQTKFVKEVAKGKTYTEAYKKAYDVAETTGTKSLYEQSSRLAKLPHIKKTLEYLFSPRNIHKLPDYEHTTPTPCKYVYLLRSKDYHKIGITKDVEYRLKQLQTASPYEIKVITAIKIDNAEKLEKELHKRYSANHIRGEWFELPTSEVDALREELERLDNGDQ